MKIKLHNSHKVPEIRKWLTDNVGPEIRTQGTAIKGEGWSIWFRGDIPGTEGYTVYVDVELVDEWIDHKTLTMFALTWS